MPDQSDLPAKVAQQFTFEEIGILEKAARELGLSGAEELLEDVMRKAEAVVRFEEKKPQAPEEPKHILRPPDELAPGSGGGAPPHQAPPEPPKRRTLKERIEESGIIDRSLRGEFARAGVRSLAKRRFGAAAKERGGQEP